MVHQVGNQFIVMAFNVPILQNSWLLNTIKWSSRLLNSTHIGQETWNVRVELYLRSYVKYDCHCADFNETCAYSTTFIVKKSYTEIHEKSDNWFIRWY